MKPKPVRATQFQLQLLHVTDDLVTVDGNHPLAGKNLNFDVSIEDVREATEEEIANGHVNGLAGEEE